MQITDCSNEWEPQLALNQQEHTINKFRSLQAPSEPIFSIQKLDLIIL